MASTEHSAAAANAKPVEAEVVNSTAPGADTAKSVEDKADKKVEAKADKKVEAKAAKKVELSPAELAVEECYSKLSGSKKVAVVTFAGTTSVLAAPVMAVKHLALFGVDVAKAAVYRSIKTCEDTVGEYRYMRTVGSCWMVNDDDAASKCIVSLLAEASKDSQKVKKETGMSLDNLVDLATKLKKKAKEAQAAPAGA